MNNLQFNLFPQHIFSVLIISVLLILCVVYYHKKLYPQSFKDLSLQTPRFMLMGLSVSTLLVITIINQVLPAHYTANTFDMIPSPQIDETLLIPPQSSQEKPPPPIRSLSQSKVVPTEVNEYIDSMEWIEEDLSLNEIDFEEVSDQQKDRVQFKLPIPPPVETDEEEPILFADRMPRFPGCEHKGLPEELLKDCAQKALLTFIYDRIRYPITAAENNIHGTCVAKFVIEKDGSVSSVQILRDIGAGCGAEIERVIGLMNAMDAPWIPGKQGGRLVRVQMSLPVSFVLN